MHRTAYRLGRGLLLLFWNSYPEKEASNCSNILPLFLWAVLWWCCCYDLMLDSKCFSLHLMLPACSHKKLLLKWGDAGCEKVICLHCGNCSEKKYITNTTLHVLLLCVWVWHQAWWNCLTPPLTLWFCFFSLAVNFKEVNEENKRELFSEVFSSIEALAFTFGNV